MIQRLRGLDAMFLSFETANAPLHVAQTCVFDPPDGEGDVFEGVRELIASRLDRVPPFRRRVVNAPFRLGPPSWVEDPDFVLDNHLHRVTLPGPGDLTQLAKFTAAFVARPLDKRRPLWDMYVVEGLEGGLVAGVTKVHHAAIDGVSGAELTANLLDLEPHPPADPPSDMTWAPDRRPSSLRMAASTAGTLARQPFAAAAAGGRLASTVVRVRRRNRSPGAVAPPAPFSAPPTALNRGVGRGRRVAFGRLDLDDVLTVKKSFAVTVNDVVLAACAGALRRTLAGAVPAEQLVAAVPVSVRTQDQRGQLGNRLSALLVGLATTVEDPVARLVAISAGTQQAKAQGDVLGANLLAELAELVAPAVGGALVRATSALGLGSRPRPLCNVIVSSFPGPAVPLYCAGARLVAPYPLGPIFDGGSLNITVQTYLDAMHVGVVTDARSPVDAWELTAHLRDALGELVKAAA